MKRLRHVLWNGLVLLSLLLAVGLPVLLAKSYKVPIFRGISVRQARYSFLLERGMVTLFIPPRLSPSIDASTLKLASQMRNVDIDWYVYPPQLRPGERLAPPRISPRLRLGSPTFEFQMAGSMKDRRLMKPLLLAALDDPDRYQAAHLLLMNISYSNPEDLAGAPEFVVIPQLLYTRRPTYWAININGLQVSLTLEQGATKEVMLLNPPSIDPAQRPAIRDRWHQSLDTRSPPLPFWPVPVLTMILPAASLWRLCRRLRRRAHNACPICGYDLRATPDRCPECGTERGSAMNPPKA